MSPHSDLGRFTLLCCCLVFAGCKGLPFADGSKGPGSLAPDFGLNSVPRQWEPDFEEGDTSPREDVRPASAFDANDEDDLRAAKKAAPANKSLIQKVFNGSADKEKSAEPKTLPKSDSSGKIDEDDFGP